MFLEVESPKDGMEKCLSACHCLTVDIYLIIMIRLGFPKLISSFVA